MTGIRSTFAQAATGAGRLLDALRPTPGTPEGALMLGLVLVAMGFFVADVPALALLVPGIVTVAVALGFSFRRAR